MITALRTLLYYGIATCLLIVVAVDGSTQRVGAAPNSSTNTIEQVNQVADCTPGPNKILTGCVYNGQDLHGADFSSSDLTSATFNGANVAGSNFSNANLTAATLDGANLSCSNFNGANLTAATLNGANLLGSTFNGAILLSTTWGTSTTCPDGTMSGDHGNTCVNNLQPAACGSAPTATAAEVATETTTSDTASTETAAAETATSAADLTATAEADSGTATDVPGSGSETPTGGGDTPTGSETPTTLTPTLPPIGTGTGVPPSRLPNTGSGGTTSGMPALNVLLVLLIMFGAGVGTVARIKSSREA